MQYSIRDRAVHEADLPFYSNYEWINARRVRFSPAPLVFLFLQVAQPHRFA